MKNCLYMFYNITIESLQNSQTCLERPPPSVQWKWPQTAGGLKSEIVLVISCHKTFWPVALKQREAFHRRGLSRQVKLYINGTIILRLHCQATQTYLWKHFHPPEQQSTYKTSNINYLFFPNMCWCLYIYYLLIRGSVSLAADPPLITWLGLGSRTDGETFLWNTTFWLPYSWNRNHLYDYFIYICKHIPWELCVKVW